MYEIGDMSVQMPDTSPAALAESARSCHCDGVHEHTGNIAYLELWYRGGGDKLHEAVQEDSVTQRLLASSTSHRARRSTSSHTDWSTPVVAVLRASVHAYVCAVPAHKSAPACTDVWV